MNSIPQRDIILQRNIKRKKEEMLKTHSSYGHGHRDTTSQIISNYNCNCNYNWLHLPDSLLPSIHDLLSPSIRDVLVFSAVCTQWRSFVKSSTPHPTVPPLLLYCPKTPNPSCSSPPPSLRYFKTQTQEPTCFPSKISTGLRNSNCVGHSYGHLILIISLSQKYALVIVDDVFTPKKFHSPDLPSGYYDSNIICYGILTAPPSSSSCTLLLVACNSSGFDVLFWHLGLQAHDWSVLKMDIRHCLRSLVVFNGKVYGALRESGLLVIELVPCLKCEVVTVDLPNPPKPCVYPRRLGVCNGELLLVFLFREEIAVYRMDFSNGVWVEVQSLGNWCLFMDRSCLWACPNPTGWGGKSDCIYVTGPGIDTWIVFPLNGIASGTFPLDYNIYGRRYSSDLLFPLWIYPSVLL